MKPGDIFGRYEITSLLARGGMAEVWLAQSRGIGGFRKRVVIKTILPELAESPDFVRMFLNEAQLAARLNHVNIVQIFDCGEVRGTYYIAMEQVTGRTLRQISRASRAAGHLIPPWFVLRTLATVCDALEYAYEFSDDDGAQLGLVHRDVTPENIMISFQGTVKILDFGVAKATAAASLTQAGNIKGKYAYIAPEQAQGIPVDHRCDVYSVGVVLYELLTGQRPFTADSDLGLLRQVVRGRLVPPRELAAWIPEPLERIVLKAMARDPRQRYQVAKALAQDIHLLLDAAGDRRTTSDMGLLVGSLFPDDPQIPAEMLRRLASARGAPSPLVSGLGFGSETEDEPSYEVSYVEEELVIEEVEAVEEIGDTDPTRASPSTQETGQPDAVGEMSTAQGSDEAWSRYLGGEGSDAEGEPAEPDEHTPATFAAKNATGPFQVLDPEAEAAKPGEEPPGTPAPQPAIAAAAKPEPPAGKPAKKPSSELRSAVASALAKLSAPVPREEKREPAPAAVPSWQLPRPTTPATPPNQAPIAEAAPSPLAAAVPEPAPIPTPAPPAPPAAAAAPSWQLPRPTSAPPSSPPPSSPPPDSPPPVSSTPPARALPPAAEPTTARSEPDELSPFGLRTGPGLPLARPGGNAFELRRKVSEEIDVFTAFRPRTAAPEADLFQAITPPPRSARPERSAPNAAFAGAFGSAPEAGSAPVAERDRDVFTMHNSAARSWTITPSSPPSGDADVFSLITPQQAITRILSSPTETKPGLAPPLRPGSEAARRFESGLACYRRGAYAEALVHWQAACELDPENGAYRTNLRKLRKLVESRGDRP